MSGAAFWVCYALVAELPGPAPTSSTATVVRLDVEVRDRAGRPQDPTATRTVIDGARLERAQRTAQDLGTLVDGVAGVRVLDLGGPLASRRLTIRGGSPAESLVVLDGVPLRSPFSSGADLGLLPPELYGSVEVLRGAQPGLGDGALTGALVLKTRRPANHTEQTIAGTIGAFSTRRLAGALAGRDYAVGAAWESTQGDFGYTSALAGLSDVERVRTNNDSARGSAGFSLEHRVGEIGLSLTAAGGLRDAGVPGLADTPGASETAREQQRSLVTRAAGKLRLGAVDLGVGLDAHVLELDYQEPALRIDSESLFWAVGGDLGIALRPLPGHRLRAEVRAGAEVSRSTVYGDPARARGGAGIFDVYADGDLTVFGGARLEGAEGQSLYLLPRIGAELGLSTEWSVRAGLGRSARLPTLDELYHPPEAGYVGNSDLVGESAWEAELALEGAVGPVGFELVGFGRRLEDTILYLHRNAYVIRPENLGAGSTIGVEAEGSLGVERGDARLGLSLSGSLLESRLDATDAPLPTQPRFSGFGELVLGYGPVEMATSIRAFSSTFVTLRPVDANVVPAYLRCDASLVVVPLDFASAALSVLNVFDDRTLTSVHRIPLPGRTVLLTLRFSTEGTEP